MIVHFLILWWSLHDLVHHSTLDKLERHAYIFQAHQERNNITMSG